jgi:hypothetical protein
MFDTRLINQVVDLERRIQIENEKKGNPQIDKYALLPCAAEPREKENKPISRGLFASLKSLTSLASFLGQP